MSIDNYIFNSVEANLFFLRIMKEHAYFLSISMPPINQALIAEAKSLNQEFNSLLKKTLTFVTDEIPVKNDAVTIYTLAAEQATSALTGAAIDTNLTSYELTLYQRNRDSAILPDQLTSLNQEALQATQKIINLKSKIIDQVKSCKLFTNIYPLQLTHILHEAEYYENLLKSILGNREANTAAVINADVFWDIIMEQHAEFIRGSLDPTEKALISEANQYAQDFNTLEKTTKAGNQNLNTINQASYTLTTEIQKYKEDLTNGLVNCKVPSIMPPLLLDHVLRETNYYLLLLKSYMV